MLVPESTSIGVGEYRCTNAPIAAPAASEEADVRYDFPSNSGEWTTVPLSLPGTASPVTCHGRLRARDVNAGALRFAPSSSRLAGAGPVIRRWPPFETYASSKRASR